MTEKTETARRLVDAELEMALIGGIFLLGTQGANIAAAHGVTIDTLATSQAIAAFHACGETLRETPADKIDPVPLAKRLKEMETPAPECGWANWVAKCLDAAPPSLSSFPQLCQALKEIERRRGVYEAGRELQEQALTAPNFDGIGKTGAKVAELAKGGGGRECLLTVNLADVADGGGVKWFWPGRVERGALTVFNGMPGAGKSLLTIDLISRLTTGRPFPDGAPMGEPGAALMLTEEGESMANTIKPRLVAAGADLSRVEVADCLVLPNGKEECFTLAHIDALQGRAEAMPGLRLMVIDPAGSYIGGDTDAGQDNKVRAVLRPLLKLADRLQIAVILVTHSRKMGAANANDLILGSRAFSGAARCIWHIGKAPDASVPERVLFLPGKISNAKTPPGLAYRIVSHDGAARLAWETEPVNADAHQIFCGAAGGERGPGRPSEALADAVDFLREYLADDDRPSAEVKDAARARGITERTLKRAQKEIGTVSTKINSVWHMGLP